MNSDLKCVSILKSNRIYRFGDIFYRRGFKWRADRNQILKNPKFKDTILREYLLNKDYESDFRTLIKVSGAHTIKKNYEIPDKRVTVVHIRLGDCFNPVDQGSGKVRGYFALRSYNHYSRLLRRIRKRHPHLKEITVVTALHFGDFESRGIYLFSDSAIQCSFKFLRFFVDTANQLGLNVKIVSNQDPDEDFCYLLHSKCMYPGLSGFSKLAHRCCIIKNSKKSN